ncbi:sce7726 family protein [Bradyrhizobium sp. BWC-3-1]|uniref:sce7726 family protein n=1 Tax=Bradyrhizobium sp. BWC-3-1 TaxID=3080012 RepID=UPI00293F2ADB|nr:sce7726 family protein [Bradyrhizobium sp. BWC-3-1]WOH58514.1 sce7726 family protein [Bradyrhizobium sp. BWC-3-1]
MRDVDVRSALRRELKQQHLGDDRTLIVEEMGIWSGAVRVDLAVINGELCGYEIKSARDNLERLPAQEALYSQVFDRVTLVVAEQHVAKAETLVPDWWGRSIASTEADGAISLKLDRPALFNPSIEPLQLARLLWRPEALSILQRHGQDRGVRSASAEKTFRRLACTVPLDTLRQEVREALKARPSWSGKPVQYEREMAVGVDLHPLSTSASAHAGIGGDRRNPLIAPTAR